MKKLKDELEAMVVQKFSKEGSSVANALAVFLSFYEVKKISLKRDDDDLLLFQYGNFRWNKGKFSLNFTRQLKDKNPESDEFYQISFTLYFDHEKFKDIQNFNIWNIDLSLNNWKTEVENSEGYVCATKYPVDSYKVTLIHT